MNEVNIENIKELKFFAKDFSNKLKPGSVICLSGDLGAGKTAFVHCVCSALNIEDQVLSPTFNIQLQYKNNEVVVNHFDLYRLEKLEELEDIGFFESIESDAFSFVEWAEKFKDQMPEDAIWITIKITGSESRKIFVS